MPAKSKSQQQLMGMALAMKRGKMSHSASAKAHKVMMGMSEEKMGEYAGTKTKGLPKHAALSVLKKRLKRK